MFNLSLPGIEMASCKAHLRITYLFSSLCVQMMEEKGCPSVLTGPRTRFKPLPLAAVCNIPVRTEQKENLDENVASVLHELQK